MRYHFGQNKLSCPKLQNKNFEDTFHLQFDNDIIDKIVDCTNIRINETIARLLHSDNFNESNNYTWVKKTDRVEIDALFGLMYFRSIHGVNLYLMCFRGIHGINLHLTDRLFSMTVILFLVQSSQKTVSGLSKTTFALATHKKEHSCGKQIDSQLLEIWEIFN